MADIHTDHRLLFITISLQKEISKRYVRSKFFDYVDIEKFLLKGDSNDTLSIEDYVVMNCIKREELLKNAQHHIDKHKNSGIKIITYLDDEYPQALKNIDYAPLLLYCKGELNLNSEKIISIVGTRSATEYGIGAVREFIEDFSKYNPVIVSGLAYGIDIESHIAALNNDLRTLAICGHGLDIIYPKSHSKYVERIIKSGGILSEYHNGVFANSYKFIERNRLIAGMASAVIVVEAPKKSGALETAKFAKIYGRHVFVVPGSIFDVKNEGSNQLLKDKYVKVITKPEDLYQALNWTSSEPKLLKKNIVLNKNFLLNERQQNFYEMLKKEGGDIFDIDCILEKDTHNFSEINSLIYELEVLGFIASMPGNRYKIL